VQGAAALSIDTLGVAGSQQIRKTVNFDPSTSGVVAYRVQLDDDYDFQCVSSVGFTMSSGGSFQGLAGVTGPGNLATGTPTKVGAFWHWFHPEEVPAVAALGPGSKTFRLGPVRGAPYSSGGKLDAMMGSAGGIPTFIFGHDDGRPTIETKAKAIHLEHDADLTAYLPTGLIGQTGRITVAQLQATKAALGNRFEPALNATPNDLRMDTDWASPAAVVAALTDPVTGSRRWLADSGLDGPGRDFLCYSNGVHKLDGARIKKTDVVSNGSAVVTMASTTGIVAGMRVVAYGIAKNMTVLSVDSGTQLTLSAAAPNGLAIVDFVNASGPFHGLKATDALAAAGFKLGRSTYQANMNNPPYNIKAGMFFTRFGMGKDAMFHPAVATSEKTWAQLKEVVDYVIKTGCTCEFYTHAIEDELSGGINTTTALYSQLVAYVAGFRNAGQAAILTPSKLYARDLANPEVITL
jgi:hypothetical protein